MENNTTLLVPTDFTPVAQSAINHAAAIAKITNGSLCLFHVISKEKERVEAETQIHTDAALVTQTYGIPCTTAVRVGSIFEDIGALAKEINAHLIFMGTHGVKGTQHLFGSHALKVITNSETPFVVVHEKEIGHGYKNVLIPIDLSKESKQIMYGVLQMLHYFQASVHLFVKQETDELFAAQVANNVSFAKRILTENNIPYDVSLSKGKSFAKEVIQEAANIKADMIGIINLKEHPLEMLGGSFEQDIIANDAQIPVMVLNQIPTSVAGFTGFYR